MVLRFCEGVKELSTRKALWVNNVDCEEVEELFIKGDGELKRVHGIIIGNDNFNGNGNDNGNNGEYFDIFSASKW